MTRAVVIIRSDTDRRQIIKWAQNVGVGTIVTFNKKRRSTDQNSLMWARLSEIAINVDWYGQKLTADDWKDVFTAALRKARIVPAIGGQGFVQLGLHTSDMSKEEMGNLLDLIDAFAAEHGVAFHDQSEECAA